MRAGGGPVNGQRKASLVKIAGIKGAANHGQEVRLEPGEAALAQGRGKKANAQAAEIERLKKQLTRR